MIDLTIHWNGGRNRLYAKMPAVPRVGDLIEVVEACDDETITLTIAEVLWELQDPADPGGIKYEAVIKGSKQ